MDFCNSIVFTTFMKYKYRTCKWCGTVYFPVSRKFAEQEVEKFNRYFMTLSVATQLSNYGGKNSSVAHYEYCWCKNSYKNFRAFKKGDCPDGVTISPIIYSRMKP